MADKYSVVKKRLKELQNIQVPDDWLRSCIDWLCGENQQSLTVKQIYQSVFEQWLETDLADLSHPIFPLKVEEKIMFNGVYCVQVNAVIDISQPFFHQIVKIKGDETEDVNYNEETQYKSQNVKPSRMLELVITDGCRILKGCEYKPIPCLSTNLAPGVKVMLKGPIECRRCILLLRNENVRIIGGQVEDLVNNYSQEQILSQALGCEIDNESVKWWLKRSVANGNTNQMQSAPTQPQTSHLSNMDVSISHAPNNEELLADEDLLNELALAMEEDF